MAWLAYISRGRGPQKTAPISFEQRTPGAPTPGSVSGHGGSDVYSRPGARPVTPMTIRRLLAETAEVAASYLEGISDRPVGWSADVQELRSGLDGPLPELPVDPMQVVTKLAADAEPGLVSSPSGRYFGFVIGGAAPAALAADWLTSAWDQNAGLYVCGPSAAVVEEVAGPGLQSSLGCPLMCRLLS